MSLIFLIKDKTLDKYFKKNTALDSEVVSLSSTAYGEYGSMARALESELRTQGIILDNRSWRMYKAGKDNN